MTISLELIALHVAELIVVPVLLTCTIRKTKALMQGRPGPPFFQPVFDLIKRLLKGETVSSTTSWLFKASPLVGPSATIVIALIVPWTGAEPVAKESGAADIILVVYLLALTRFFSVLAALDAGSAFGGLGASREATLAVLIEPSILVSLSAVAIASRTMDLSIALVAAVSTPVALLAGSAFVMAALAELSRMPVDDPTTHLELTMIHEATLLEYSGRSLALIEITVALRTALFFGIGVRVLTAWAPLWQGTGIRQGVECGGTIVLAGVLLGVLEGVSVKLNWRRVPAFVAFSTALALMSAFVAVVGV